MFETNVDTVNLSFFNLLEEVNKKALNVNLFLGQEIYCRNIEGFEKTLNYLDETYIPDLSFDGIFI